MISKDNRLVGAILLISGTTIGAAMLALPITTGLTGFIPSTILMIALWLFMMLTAFYLLEVNLRLKGETNLISMMKKTLGLKGEIASWIVYLLLLYALIAAYMVGCSQILTETVAKWIGFNLPTQIWPLLIFIVFGTFVYCGTVVSDFLNRFLMLGLFVGYIILLFVGIPHIHIDFLLEYDLSYLGASLAVLLTSFGYHIIIPTLTTYLEHDTKRLKKAIVVGSLIPLIVYLMWQFLVIGVLPKHGANSLSEAANEGMQATIYLKKALMSPYVTTAALSFAFFSIVTSLLGVGLSLSDFLADGLKLKKTAKGKGVLALLTFTPPLLFALFYPQGFILALKYAGIFVVILLALFPPLMAWNERYKKHPPRSFIKSELLVFGGKPLMVITIVLSLVLLLFEVIS